MTKNDYDKFGEIIVSVAEYYGRSMTEHAVGFYWKLVQDLSIEEFEKMIINHCADPEIGQFFPLLSHLNKQRCAYDPVWRIYK